MALRKYWEAYQRLHQPPGASRRLQVRRALSL